MENQRVGEVDVHTYSAFLTKEEMELVESVREKKPQKNQEKTEIIPRRNRNKTEVSPTSDRDKTENNHNDTVSLPTENKLVNRVNARFKRMADKIVGNMKNVDAAEERLEKYRVRLEIAVLNNDLKEVETVKRQMHNWLKNQKSIKRNAKEKEGPMDYQTKIDKYSDVAAILYDKKKIGIRYTKLKSATDKLTKLVQDLTHSDVCRGTVDSVLKAMQYKTKKNYENMKRILKISGISILILWVGVWFTMAVLNKKPEDFINTKGKTLEQSDPYNANYIGEIDKQYYVIVASLKKGKSNPNEYIKNNLQLDSATIIVTDKYYRISIASFNDLDSAKTLAAANKGWVMKTKFPSTGGERGGYKFSKIGDKIDKE